MPTFLMKGEGDESNREGTIFNWMKGFELKIELQSFVAATQDYR